MQSILTLSAEQIRIAPEGEAPVTVLPGLAHIVEKAFRQGAPNAAQLEAAINLIEDALQATGWRVMPRGALVTDALLLQQALGVVDLPAYWSLAQVEQRYQDIAQAALRLPAAPVAEVAPMPLAALILVRECMHHLGYSDLVLV